MILAIPVSTPMAVQNKGLPFARFVAPFMPVIMWRSNPERAKMLDPRYDLGYLGFPTHKGSDLSHLIRIARKNLHAVTCPILVVQSHADETITPDSADIILRGVSSERKGVLWLHKVPHVCTITCETENIAHAACEMLREAEKKE